MSEVTYQILTNGESFRTRSKTKRNFLWFTWDEYRWESWYPYYKSYGDAYRDINKLFGARAIIEERTWRQT